MKLSALAGEAFAPDPDIIGLAVDSRAVERGFLFAALPGEKVDGARFIPQAEEKGAAAILARPGAATRLPLVADDNPRARLAQMAARFYPRQPDVVAGVTGTNGKTSTAHFAAQLWSMLGRKSAGMGTLGIVSDAYEAALTHTTPEPVTLHRHLQAMTEAGVTHLAMEVSSHALAQARADGVRFSIAAFSNITQDHLDYHADFEDYIKAKLRLFAELLGENGTAVVNENGEAAAQRFSDAAAETDSRLITTGPLGKDLQLMNAAPHSAGLRIAVRAGGASRDLDLPLIGAFQAENALLAAGIVMASGAAGDDVLPLLEKLEPVRGRMEFAASAHGGSIYVDYAHTPDALKAALVGIRPHVGGRLIAIIGAGGDRDKSKRKMMGSVAHAHADKVIVTDDNPRTEDPAEIRQQVLAGCHGAVEIGDRGEAIANGVAMLRKGDVLLIAGKGHETGQQAGAETLPFDDVKAAQAAASETATGS